jgi:hypothetical protein
MKSRSVELLADKVYLESVSRAHPAKRLSISSHRSLAVPFLATPLKLQYVYPPMDPTMTD